MKLTATLKLQPSEYQRQLLYQTLERANAACNSISERAWAEQVFGRVPVHHLTYSNVRAEFELTAQLAVRCIGKVVDAYKLDKKVKRLFKKLGAVPYDERILNFRLKQQNVSIWLLGGREVIPFVTGAHQAVLLQYQHGESDLVHRKGEFYLYTTCDAPDDAPIDPEGWLGVDLGIANIAVDSTGEFFQGKTVKSVRFRHRKLRTNLQAKGTLGTRRRLKKLAGKEQRFATHTNHTISKHLVKKAQDTRRGIALENLEGIRERITVRKPQRAGLHSWSFAQLRSFIEYKAQCVGVPVVAVDPRNTSRTCPACGHIDKANRKTQDAFSCISCGFAARADYVAAINIGRRAAVNQPDCSDKQNTA
ncbi:MAG: transposase [Chloroflexota bacterium]